ncbi:MAG: hypothetical protein P4M15_08360 [Alphaproteobacteria bacterium]|nr:hypothetical protein [Alphaproteobacteria bacterium]
MRFPLTPLIFSLLAAACMPVSGPDEETGVGNARGISAEKICTGAIPVPSLAANECGGNYLWAPTWLFESAQGLVSSPNPVAHEQSVFLPDVDRFFAKEAGPNSGWAASLQMSRGYLRLLPFEQKDFFWLVTSECPRLESWPEPDNADAYKAFFTAAKLGARFDEGRSSPHFARDSGDIVASLQHGRPVIMFGGDRGMLVTGAVYDYPVPRGGKIYYRIKKLYVLDPSGDGGVSEIGRFGICAADAYLSF